MKTTLVPVMDSTELELFIGRKRHHISLPSQLLMSPEVTDIYADGLIIHRRRMQVYQLLVNGERYATMKLKPGCRSSIKITKRQHGLLQIYFIKKYTTLH